MPSSLEYRSAPYAPERPRSRGRPIATVSLFFGGLSLGLCAAGTFVLIQTHSDASGGFLSLGVIVSVLLGLPIACIALAQRGPKRFALFALFLNLVAMLAPFAIAVCFFHLLD